MTSWPKKMSEFPKDGISYPMTLLPGGKHSLMLRAFERYKTSENHLDKLDAMYSFFTHAFHLKEWIQHFKFISDFDVKWKLNYSGNKYYLLCQDFCNKSKHIKLTRPEVTSKIGIISKPQIENEIRTEVNFIRFDEEFIPVLVLMEKLIEFWRDIFNKENCSF